MKALIDIAAPFDDVVRELASFEGLASWHPAFEGVSIEGEGAGAIRTLELDGQRVRDRLDEIGEGGRGYRYTQLEGPIECRQHQGYFWVRRSDDGTATVEWAARIKDPVLPEMILEPILGAIFEAGLEAAKARLEA